MEEIKLGLFSIIGNLFRGKPHGDVSAIILCAGNSTRFSQGTESKQLATVCGKSVIAHTIEAFDGCEDIREIILVVRKEDAQEYEQLVCEFGFRKVECIVIGGETRQISAMRGFKHVSPKSKYVAIHDGARCLVTPKIITKVATVAKQYNAATAATQVTDTVKVSDENGFIVKTVNRELMWNVQTPQIFEKNLYQLCIENAKENGVNATDDCMLVEAYGEKVKLVETGRENIKITVKNDISLAEAILMSRKEENEE